MATNNITSALIAEQLPDFIQEDAPKFQKFIEAYYEWMEQSGNATERAKNLLDYRDIDNTLDQFIQYFKSEVMDRIPQTALADKRLLVKHIKDLYRAKGTQAAYRLLFRMIYNEEIDFYYPGVDMLRTSDGRWIQETSIRVSSPGTGDRAELDGLIIYGAESGAHAKVERVEKTSELGVQVDEMFLSAINGTFNDGELVRNASNTINGTVFSTTGPLSGFNVTQGGGYHQVGDVIQIVSDTSGTGANGVVIRTSDTSSINFTLRAGGSGYRLGNSVITIAGGSGLGASFTINGISNTSNVTFGTTTIEAVKDVPLNSGPVFASGVSNTQVLEANIAAANVSSTLASALQFAEIETGTISGITVTDVGFGYNYLPTATIVDQEIADKELQDPNGGIKGQNAVVTVANIPGAITAIRLNSVGSSYDKYNTASIANSDRAGTQAGKGLPLVTGLITHPGRYVDTKGFLSYNNKLQDNFYYQEYSYVVKSTQFVDTYKNLVKELIHPAGQKIFGQLQVEAELDASTISTQVYGPDLELVYENTLNVPVIVSDSVETYTQSQIGAIVSDVSFVNLQQIANTVPVTVPATYFSRTSATGVNLQIAKTIDTTVGTVDSSNSMLWTAHHKAGRPLRHSILIKNTFLISSTGTNTISNYLTSSISSLTKDMDMVLASNTSNPNVTFTFGSRRPTAGQSIIIRGMLSQTAIGNSTIYTVNNVVSNTKLFLTRDFQEGDVFLGTMYIANNMPGQTGASNNIMAAVSTLDHTGHR